MLYICDFTRVRICFQMDTVVKYTAVRHALIQRLLHDGANKLLEEIATQGGGIRYFLWQSHTKEPVVSYVDLDFFYQTLLRGDAEKIDQ